jgi:nucleotide-binding universal stress UspA family protein
VLLDESDGAQMLVVGSRGHGGFMGLLLGSVSASVAEHATCPVLVLHGNEPPLRLVS